MRAAKPDIHKCLRRAVEREPRFGDCGPDDIGDAMNLKVQEKIREFRDRAQKSKLLATFTDEKVVKRIYEDAARQWEDLAENLEKRGRVF